MWGRDWWSRCSAGTQVQSPGQHSGLGIRHCHSCGSNLIPGPGIPYALEWPKKENKQTNPKSIWLLLLFPPKCSFLFCKCQKAKIKCCHCAQAWLLTPRAAS